MRKAETILSIISKRGQRGLPVNDVYRSLYQKELYLRAYGKLYSNNGAMTEGVTSETMDGMSLKKIDTIINALRYEKYRWKPVRRVYITKKQGKSRPLGLPTWSDKLLQEVIRSILEAYYELQFSPSSHGFRPKRGCHTALREVMQKGRGTKWFIEGDISACFDKIDHTILLDIIREKFQDNRFVNLISMLLKAGYLEDWKFNTTLSGSAQGSVTGPIFSNLVLDCLDKYVEQTLIPAYTRGKRRKKNLHYDKLIVQASKARKTGDWKEANVLSQQAQCLPSTDPNDPNYRRLWYVRYADDFLLGLAGPKNEAIEIKHKVAQFLNNNLKLELNADKTLITHASSQKAKFLGYEVHILQEDSEHDHNGRRRINGSIGLRVPNKVVQEKCKKYMKNGKPIHLHQCTIDDAYSIVSQYQAEYRGIVQYYRMAYNLHILNKLRYMTEVSLVKTLASKYKTTCTKIYKKYSATIKTNDGTNRKVILVKRDSKLGKPLITHFGGISLKWNKWANISEKPAGHIWSKRTELIERLEAQECELCGSQEEVEVHHIRKLANLKQKGVTKVEWQQKMIARNRKTLIVCRKCHNNIHHGRYNGRKLSA
jgi:group II intron reverse transcriptase/maturase